jgi:RNA polymerase sigma-70 factor (ECF subfamily)
MRTQNSLSSCRALDVLVRRRAEFLASVRGRVRSAADAEDIVQTAFLRCLEHQHSLRAAELAIPWFHGILANAAVDHFRRRASRARALLALATEPREPACPPDQDAPVPVAGASVLLDRLSAQYRQALHIVYLDAGGLPKLAAEARITVNNAAVRVFRQLGEPTSTGAAA